MKTRKLLARIESVLSIILAHINLFRSRSR